MLEALTRYWWVVGLRGAAAVIFGVLALVWPDITVFALVILFGAYALADGAFALGSAVFDRRAVGRRGWLVVEGIAGILIGIVTFLWPGATTLVLLWLIAAWAIVTGGLEIITAVQLRREIEGEWIYILSGALSVLFGILLAAWPATGAIALVIVIGVFSILFGILLVALGLRLRRMGREGAVSGTARPVPA
jgi:uncharacterized membrane protein HdeD (DUF308 family)